MRKLRLNEMVPIFGKSWPTKDGTCVRDYIHVVDLATAHSAALELVLKNKSILNLNIGNGKGISVLEVIKTFSKLLILKIPYYFSEKRDGDAPFVVAENSLALKKLNWQPIKILMICVEMLLIGIKKIIHLINPVEFLIPDINSLIPLLIDVLGLKPVFS